MFRALVVLVGVLAVAAPAAAAPPRARLVVTVRPASGAARAATLTCEPTGGTHTNAVAACADLAVARGRMDRVGAGDGVCTMQYAPVTATLRGRWHGRPVRFTRTYGNACAMEQATGSVFDL